MKKTRRNKTTQQGDAMNRFTDEQLRIFEKHEIECRDAVKLLGDYEDGDLPEALRIRLTEHIQSCPACSEFEQTYRLTMDLAKELRPQIMPAGAKKRLREALNRRLGLHLSTEEA